MKAMVSKYSGYCSGVKRAIKTLDNTILQFGGTSTIYTLGDIIHNSNVLNKYDSKGVVTLSEIKGLKKNDNLVIRSHGVPPGIIKKLTEKGVNVFNATCPFVLKVHELAKKLSQKGYYIVLIGNENHPEVIGIKGNITGIDFKIVSTIKDAGKINCQKKIAVISQTTQTRENFVKISKKIIEKIQSEILILNTTCKATELRQKDVALLAKNVDIMVVIGGKNSANTKHLVEISKNILPDTYHIANEYELDKSWFAGKKSAGICSGASTPTEDVTRIKNIIESI